MKTTLVPSEETIHVPAIDRAGLIAMRWFAGLALGLNLTLVFVPGGSPFAAAFVVFVVAIGATLVWMGRLAQRGTAFDATGIGPTEGGIRRFMLAWEQFGGFRAARVSIGERLWRPASVGYEILDREGRTVFVAPINAHTRTTLSQAIRQEMLRRAPQDGPRGESYRERPTRSAVGSAVAWGALWSLVAIWGLSQPILSRVYGVGIVACLVAPTAFLLALSRILERRAWANGKLPVRELPAPLPEEGPELLRHTAAQGSVPLLLQEGGRYRIVEPERLRAELQRSPQASGWAIAGCVILGAVFAYWGWTDRRIWELSAFGVVLWGGLAILGFSSLRVERTRLESVDDALWIQDGRIVVVRPGKAPWSLPMPTTPEIRARFRRGWLGITDVLRNPDGSAYYLDRTRLYAAPTESLELDG